MRWERLTPREVAGLDAAMTSGIAAAILKASGLLIIKTGKTGDGGWICAYPPAGLSPVAAHEWARRNGLCFARDDLHLTHEEVVRAGSDMDVILQTRAAAHDDAADNPQAPDLQATFEDARDISLPAPFVRAQASVWKATAATPLVSPAGGSDGRASRAWMRAFQAGFHASDKPVQTDDASFVELLQVADLRRANTPLTGAGNP